LVKIGFISVSTAALIFVSGFFSGYQRAAVIFQPVSEIVTLALPQIVSGAATDIEPQRPEVIAAGEDIDVDQPAVQDKVIINTPVKIRDFTLSKQALNPESGRAPSRAKNPGSIDAIQDTGDDSNRQISGVTFEVNIESVKGNGTSEKEKRTSVNNYDQNKVITDKQISTVSSIAFDSEELKKIKYSIQVGMYSRLVNAENMVNLLQAQQFDAYVSENINKKNEVLYNVRFGYFADKKTAATALQEYKDKKNGDGYLVKFSLKSVTSIAGVEDLKPSNNTEKSSKDLSPVTLPSAVSQENISQLEMSKASSTLTNNQTNIIAN